MSHIFRIRFDYLVTQWTFHPNQGKDGPKTCDLKTSGIYVQSHEEHDDNTGDNNPHFCMLVQVEHVVQGKERPPQEAMAFRRTEMMRHFPIAARQFDFEGNLMDQNAQALEIFGSQSYKTNRASATVKETGGEHNNNNSFNETTVNDDLQQINNSQEQQQRINSATSDFLAQFADLDEGKQVWEEAKEGHDYSMETLQNTQRGQAWFSIDVRRVQDPVTSELVVIYSARDITKIMQSAKEEAEKQNRSKNQFFAVMAHEIRTPLHQVVGLIELLAEAELSDDQKDSVHILQTSSHALMAIINDVLDFTKLEAGQMKLESMPFEIRGVIDGCLAAVQRQVEAKEQLTIASCIENSIPVKLMGDPNRLRQIILNLLTNAIKFSKNGQIHVKAAKVTESEENGTVVVKVLVQDPGIGISAKKQRLIFDAFQQADASITRSYGGTGLGLAICKNLVETLMDGQIGVESELGNGSTFWFEVPFQKYTKTSSSNNLKADDNTDEDVETPCHILVVEDNVVNQKVVSKMLHSLGHTYVIAENGQVALDAICEEDQEPFDVVLMDWQMPVMDGIDATKELRNRGYGIDDLPVVGLTASIQGLDWHAIGMNDCLKKPIRLADLKKAIAANRPKSSFTL